MQGAPREDQREQPELAAKTETIVKTRSLFMARISIVLYGAYGEGCGVKQLYTAWTDVQPTRVFFFPHGANLPHLRRKGATFYVTCLRAIAWRP